MTDDPSQKFFSHDFSRFAAGFIYLIALLVLLFCLFMMLAMFRISSNAFHCYDNPDDLPYHRVGLLLGTSPQQAPGVPNDYFTARIKAAAQLFRLHKIDYILASGDNRAMNYNEPREMRRALIKEGVPKDRIVMDFAGIRTLDSVMRAKSVFMLRDVTVISQDFHNERALFIAAANGLKAVGFNATEPDSMFTRAKVGFREFFARLMCVFDVYFLETTPRFYGEPIRIGDAAMPVMPSNKPRHATSKPKLTSDNAVMLMVRAEIAQAEQERLAAEARAELERQRARELAAMRLAEENSETAQDNVVSSPDAPSTIGEIQSDAVSNAEQQQALLEAASTAAQSLKDSEGAPAAPAASAPSPDENTQAPVSHGDPWDL